MQNIDLNISLDYFHKFDDNHILNAIGSLFDNEITTPATYNHLKELSIEYDSSTQTLKIINKRWNIRPTDFVITDYLGENNYKLLSGLIRLMANNYRIVFNSKFGKFIPYIDKKQDLKTPVATIHLEVEDVKNTSSKFTNLKDSFNGDMIDSYNGTIITISPFSSELVKDLKDCFSWTCEWKEIMHAGSNYLLINKCRKFNTIYLNGWAFKFYEDWQPQLLYSYDISSHFMDHIEGDHGDDWYTQRVLCVILDNLSNEDKKKIFPTILNNKECLEWTYPEVQKLIIRFLNKQYPDQYVIYSKDLPMHNEQIDVVEQTHKIVIILDDDVYKDLENEVTNIYRCYQRILVDKYCQHEITEDDLSPSEKTNFKLLKEFFVYLANHYAPLKKQLAEDGLDTLPIAIISDYPDGTGAFSYIENKALIDRANLHDFGKTLTTASKIVWDGFATQNYHEFTNIWLKNTVDFFNVLKTDDKNKNNK